MLTHWALDAARTAPRQRTIAQTPLDAAARAALCAEGPVVSAPTSGRRASTAWSSALEATNHVLAAWLEMKTAFVERLTLDLRQRVAAIGRRGTTLGQGEAGLREQLRLCHVYYNWVVPHARLRQLLPPSGGNGSGSTKVWRPCTPAMAVGVTDHV